MNSRSTRHYPIFSFILEYKKYWLTIKDSNKKIQSASRFSENEPETYSFLHKFFHVQYILLSYQSGSFDGNSSILIKIPLCLRYPPSVCSFGSKGHVALDRVATHTRFQNSLTFPWPFPDLSAFFPDQSNILILRYLRIHTVEYLNNRFVHALYMFQIANLCE